MATRKQWLKQFIVAALCSAVASLMIVAVGPGFSKPDAAADKSKGAEASASSNAGGNSSKGNSETAGGGGGDHDGDADSNPATALEDDHTTADAGDNAHPSGKDRSIENGKSGNQGKAESNPDDSKGPQRFEGGRGDDKPQGPGGNDRADQDGNNGCGNDDDFDDDNNGWCGKPKSSSSPPGGGGNSNTVCPAGTDKAGKTMPGGDSSKCNNGTSNTGGPDPKPVCPAGTDKAGKTMPAGDSSKCNNGSSNSGGPDKPVCPAGTDKAGKTMPAGDPSKCNNGGGSAGKITICHQTGSATNPWVIITVSVNAWPAHQAHGDMIKGSGPCGTAGSTTNPPPGDGLTPPPNVGGIDTPDDDVLGDTVSNDGGSDGSGDGNADEVEAAAAERESGAVLPFTGASIVAYTLIALQMIGAGFLISRARKNKS